MLKISLLHAPDYMILTGPKIEKNLPTVGDTPLPHPPPARSLRSSGLVAPLPRICSQNIFCVFLEVRYSPPPPPPPPPPPTFEDLSTPLIHVLYHPCA